MEGGGGGGDCRRPGSDAHARTANRRSSSKRKATTDLEEDLRPEEESRLPAAAAKDSSYLPPPAGPLDVVLSAYVIPGSKHRDGSIYRRDAHYWHGLYQLDVTRETRLEPMTPWYSEQDCKPCVADCQWHMGGSMMQIFSLKLAEISNFATGAAGASAIQLYGFMAVRDLLDPFRNYVFNRTRDDPFTICDVPYPFIQMTGPRRGIDMDCRVMIEYDMRIKMRGENEQDDLVLVDGAATFNGDEIMNFIPHIYRIHGDCGMAVDIRLAYFINAIQATTQVRIYELKDGCGSLNLTMTCEISYTHLQMKLFQGPIDKLRDQNRFVVAAKLDTDDYRVQACPSAWLNQSEICVQGCTTWKYVSLRQVCGFCYYRCGDLLVNVTPLPPLPTRRLLAFYFVTFYLFSGKQSPTCKQLSAMHVLEYI